MENAIRNRTISPQERILNFDEFHKPLEHDVRIEQAGRCMNCGVPFCQSAMNLSGMVTGCPLHNLIPEWNGEISCEHDAHAFSRLQKTSNFPEFTGRVCPALCEKACMCGQSGDAVTIHDNELYLVEQAFEKGYIKPRIPAIRSGKRVAVIGSGPAGLAVADTLNHRGHVVDVYEREDEVGGLLMYGIPNMKLDKSVIRRRRNLMEKEGVRFHTGCNVGMDRELDERLKEYDALVFCCGAKQARMLDTADPAKVKNIIPAVEFLTQTTKVLMKAPDHTVASFKETGGYINAAGKHVVIVGGGDTGNDCIATAIRHGAKSVTALEMMPKPPKERLASNPWPEWPKIEKVDYGHEESIYVFGRDPRVYETTIKRVIPDKKGAIKQIETVQVSFANGKPEYVEGTEKTIRCDLLLIAAGFTGCESYTVDAFSIKCGPRNTVATAPDSYRIPDTKYFAAGDMHRGQSLVVWAIAEGRACAREVDTYLMGYTNL